MKSSEVRELTTKELREKLDNERNLMTRMQLNHAVSPLDNPMKIKETRRNVARMATELRQRQLNGN
ncbi:MAG: 50S ribosomal protein L29 [Bacteroidales bacterium]|jgi:large subunit ribosomal protein L29|nr:50S ribosomal protein L29 [Bacteroidales bacterium]